MMGVQSEKFLNTVRGKVLVGHATSQEILKVFEHLDALENFLDDRDGDDAFGTEGWRHAIGIPS
ncbi:hypothetical protein [Brucella pseudogrignonensis]|uniref:Uncharacterized protein n=1 Tax=Brucella pseudogrignonensis TaxID=419475 RepID=A0ABU1M4X3_9HYPH|nr:hypothetical protein [Brucella pseudogrignonensis]MDR6431047.1 hypothetical protein [Brucella pseudogrignonensis]